MLNPPANGKIQGLSRLERFSSTFKANFIFKAFEDSLVLYSSTFQACANPLLCLTKVPTGLRINVSVPVPPWPFANNS